jgi:lactate dehydrogenase-like 2-hydroxyacid dehydrogenase
MIIVNTSRGGIVDEHALIIALWSGMTSGYATFFEIELTKGEKAPFFLHLA